jgi:hypothetical protein
MKPIQLLSIILFSFLLFLSCSQEIVFNGKLLEPKLVVNSICMLDSVISVEVSESKPIPGYETDYKLITDATVKLFVDGKETESLAYDSLNNSSQSIWGVPQSAYYRGKTVIQEGHQYKIEVGEPSFTTLASGEMKMPGKIPIEKVDTTITLYHSEFSSVRQRYQATIRFTDPSNEKNYYRLNVTYRFGRDQSYVDDNGDSVKLVQVMDYIYNYGGIDSDDPVFASNSNADDMLFGSNNSGYTLFTDEIFNGKRYDLRFYLSDGMAYYLQSMNTDRLDFYAINIELQSIDQETYYYLKSLSLMNTGDGGLFTEPVQIYNNIENGLGIFGGCSSSLYSIKKGMYPIEGVEYFYGSVSD